MSVDLPLESLGVWIFAFLDREGVHIPSRWGPGWRWGNLGDAIYDINRPCDADLMRQLRAVPQNDSGPDGGGVQGVKRDRPWR